EGWPLGKMQLPVLDLEDHFGSLLHVLRERRHIPALRQSRSLDWDELIARASSRTRVAHVEDEEAPAAETPAMTATDANFIRRMNSTREWSDFDLLLRALTKMHARPLLISAPICARCYGPSGTSNS